MVGPAYGQPNIPFERPDEPIRGQYIVVDPQNDPIPLVGEGLSNIIYLNRCVGGCVITPGGNDAQKNRSTVFDETTQLSQFSLGDETWQEVIDCVRMIYKPFNILITDEDPGETLHHEAIVAGTTDEAGVEMNVGGLAPLAGDCSPLNNAMSFTFANSGQTAVESLCWTIVQESAHAFGLDHVFACPDPMTYVPGCGTKYFRDQSLPCGETEERECKCGEKYQNSHCKLSKLFGLSDDSPKPTVSSRFPLDGETVDQGFHFYVDASDPRGIARVEFFVNGSLKGWVLGHSYENKKNPYHFEMPKDLPPGTLVIETRALNDIGVQNTSMVTLHNGSACFNSTDCGEGLDCVDKLCVEPQPTLEFGTTCTKHSQCKSGYCRGEGSQRFCNRFCISGLSECDLCPENYECKNGLQGEGYCWTPLPSSGCGCSHGNGGLGTAIFAFFVFVLVLGKQRKVCKNNKKSRYF